MTQDSACAAQPDEEYVEPNTINNEAWGWCSKSWDEVDEAIDKIGLRFCGLETKKITFS